ncbi:hypothetical protein ES703_06083 [subsurface metagenome]
MKKQVTRSVSGLCLRRGNPDTGKENSTDIANIVTDYKVDRYYDKW